jgi:hypothetical protein
VAKVKSAPFPGSGAKTCGNGSGPASLLGLIHFDCMRQKDAGAEQSEKCYDCVNHDELTFAQCPALDYWDPRLRDCLFQDDFFVPLKLFRQRVPPTPDHALLLPCYPPWGCESRVSPDLIRESNAVVRIR